jgi:dipeptidyl aminopeptidase/acylaminoacyl peptidase
VSVRRLAIAVSLALLALGVSSATAAAPVAPGPRLAYYVSRAYPDMGGLETVGPDGGAPVRLLAGPGAIQPHGSRPAWSPDGTRIAFTDSYGEYSPVIYVADVEGGKPRLVSKGSPLGDPIFSPDGHWLAYATLRVVKGHFERPGAASGRYGVIVDWSVRAVNVDTGKHKQLTPWRRHLQLAPTSFSPDGRKFAALSYDGKTSTAVAVDLASGRTTVLATGAREPIYSPDGSRIAFVRTHYGKSPRREGSVQPGSSDLYVMPATGGKAKKLAHVRGGLGWPSWDPSGQRITFTTLDGSSIAIGGSPADLGNSVMEINADGTCLTTLLSIKSGFYGGTAWQPGPGREAGPIAC